VVHRNVQLSAVTVFDVLDSDHLPTYFHILDHVRATDISAPVENHRDWERLRSPAPELISPLIHIHNSEEAGKAARNFTASIASAYRLTTCKLLLSELNNELSDRSCGSCAMKPGNQHVKRHLTGSPRQSTECTKGKHLNGWKQIKQVWDHTTCNLTPCEIPY
jgi:hypothetical protein